MKFQLSQIILQFRFQEASVKVENFAEKAAHLIKLRAEIPRDSPLKASEIECENTPKKSNRSIRQRRETLGTHQMLTRKKEREMAEISNKTLADENLAVGKKRKQLNFSNAGGKSKKLKDITNTTTENWSNNKFSCLLRKFVLRCPIKVFYFCSRFICVHPLSFIHLFTASARITTTELKNLTHHYAVKRVTAFVFINLSRTITSIIWTSHGAWIEN